MSTRCNIIIKEGNQKLFFYRHSDGYPEGAMPLLKTFCQWVKEGKIRGNLSQSAGWLVLLGAMEYNAIPEFKTEEPAFKNSHAYGDVNTIQPPADWKCGAIEPTTGIHGDIKYLYVIDLAKATLIAYEGDTEKVALETINFKPHRVPA